jgi:catechol 2,3-dioxygenase
VGLYHTAFLFPDRVALARALRRAIEAGVEIEGAADHGVSEAVYFSDPDGNGIELYHDRAPEDWPRDGAGQLRMVNARLDLEALLTLA